MIKHGGDSCVKWVFDKAGYLKQIPIIPRDHHILALPRVTSQNHALLAYTRPHTRVHPRHWAGHILVICPKSIQARSHNLIHPLLSLNFLLFRFLPSHSFPDVRSRHPLRARLKWHERRQLNSEIKRVGVRNPVGARGSAFISGTQTARLSVRHSEWRMYQCSSFYSPVSAAEADGDTTAIANPEAFLYENACILRPNAKVVP